MSFSRRQRAIGGVAAAAALVIAGCGANRDDGGSDVNVSADAEELVFAFEGPEETAQGIAADIFQEGLEEASDGQMTVEQFPGAQLGGEPELLEKVRSGDLDFVISSTANAAAIAPESGVFSIHYLMGDADEAVAVFTDDNVDQAYKDMAAEMVEGAQPLTLFMLPLRNMYGNFEVHSVADIEGKKVRVQATATEDAIFAAYGAQTVHMAFPELYSALQTGVVEAAENAVTYYGLNKHHEVAPIMSMTEHEANGQVIWVSDATWESLTSEQQDAVTAAADKVHQEQPAQAIELQDELRAEYEELGVKFVTDVDKATFEDIAVPMQDQIAADLGPHAVAILEQVRAATGG